MLKAAGYREVGRYLTSGLIEVTLIGEPFGSWVEHISQPIAEQVDGHHHQH